MIDSYRTRGFVLPATMMVLVGVGILSTGSAAAGQAVYRSAGRALGMESRSTAIHIQPRAALTTIGNLRLGGSARVDGQNSVPSGWTGVCGEPGPDKPGVLVDDLSEVSRLGNAHAVEGDPPLAEDPGLTSESLLTFGEHTWADLVALADFRFPGGASVTETYPDSILIYGSFECHTDFRLNWGDPTSPGSVCGDHFPVIYAAGDLRIDGNDRGQGILLVEGSLTVTGGFQFYGPVIVRGTVTTEGTGGSFVGGLIAANISLDQSTVLGDAAVQYSACTVERAGRRLLSLPSPAPSPEGLGHPPVSVK